MRGNLHYMPVFIFYFLCCEILTINSHTSTLWKLNSDKTKIIEGSPFQQVVSPKGESAKTNPILEDDPVFNIITSTVHLGQSWVKEGSQCYCTNCHALKNTYRLNNSIFTQAQGVTSEEQQKDELDEILDCGKPVNFTYYDNLVGIANRHRHPSVPDPQAVSAFIKKAKNKNGLQDFDTDALERKLKKAKKEKPKSVQLYNQIGNFLRIKGDSEKAIECFRRALAVSPHNAEVLLNLARVLYTLQYLDDAIYLTRRSLEVQPPDKGAWQQHFMLGEIFKAYGHYQEASVHLRHTLELKPGYEPAQTALKEMEMMPATTIHIYTLVIIVCLVMGVLLVILSSVDNSNSNENSSNINNSGDSFIGDSGKSQKHFHKAMSVRSLRLAAQKYSRSKKLTA